jgi:hypothetical protein
VELEAKLGELDTALERVGRSRDDVRLFVGPNRHPVNADSVAAYQALGVEQIVVPLGARTLEKLAMRTDELLASGGR